MKKFLVMILVISLLSFSVPKKTEAQYVDVVNAAKEFGFDTVAYIFAKIVLKQVTAKTVNWINSGFKGNPGYITNPKQFFLDVGDNVASEFLSTAGINQLCAPFKAQVRLALVKNYINDNNNYSCTLSIIRDNYDAFTRDFGEGGWDAWFEVTQNSQNNPYGAYLEARNQLSIQVESGKNQLRVERELGSGLLDFKRCPAAAKVTQDMIDQSNALIASGNLSADNSAVVGKAVGDCLVEEETVTPGTAINDQLSRSLGSAWNQLEAADEINEVVTALVTQLIEQVAGKVGGLRGASEPSATRPSLVQQIFLEPQPRPVVNRPITATQPTLNCTATGGTGGGGGDGGDPTLGGGGTGGDGGNGGNVVCRSTPGVIGGNPGWPRWPLGTATGGGDQDCPAYTQDSSINCLAVDSGAVLAILNKYPITNNGFRAAMEEVKGLYPWAEIIEHNVGSGSLDKIDFGNGMIADVIGSAAGLEDQVLDDGSICPGDPTGNAPVCAGGGWVFQVACECNHGQTSGSGSGSGGGTGGGGTGGGGGGGTGGGTTPAPTISTLKLTITGLGKVTDGVDTCNYSPNSPTTTCSKNYVTGTNLTLTVTPAPNAVFVGWGGDCVSFGTGLTCSGAMSVDRNVTATFR